ncbi:MAG: hypothetical protein JKY51_03720 [Opitutaceae bacterium]|nr:hypothetical protein [Opitutaceae bacterium]
MRYLKITTCLLFASLFPVLTFQVAAQSSDASGFSVKVREVAFASMRPAGAGDSWLETTVELDVRGDGTLEGANSRYVDRVKVALSLGIQSRLTENGFRFFRSEAEAVTLKNGKAQFRFYLPPEVVERDRVRGRASAYMVQIYVDGKLLPLASENVSGMLRTGKALQSFKDHIARDAIRNEGILVSQFDSPFLFDYRGSTPSFVRKQR